jgi:drug/metabolite transporter (DMT)-like permease
MYCSLSRRDSTQRLALFFLGRNLFAKQSKFIFSKNITKKNHNMNVDMIITSGTTNSPKRIDTSRLDPIPRLYKHYLVAGIYILSGTMQPLLMTLVKQSGLGDPTCQIYMLMYYFGPSLVGLSVCRNRILPPKAALIKAFAIALIDIIAQTINYTGSTMSGPTIFAIIYSSVTVWTAVFSKLFLSRRMNSIQWLGVWIVFLGLILTATNSAKFGPEVFTGALLVTFGSSLHAMTYVLSEALMVRGDRLSVQMNCAFQGFVACFLYLFWQLIYTRPHYHELIEIPMQTSGTDMSYAICLLLSLSLSNLVHALSFFYTLRHFPGGATSAGVMKGLQAVMVFLCASLFYCGSFGGEEMCFTQIKFISLLIVISGVLTFANGINNGLGHESHGSAMESGYSPVADVPDCE